MNDAAPIARQIEPELLELLGSFIVKWSFVEACVSDLFVLLTRGDPGTMIAVTGSTSANTITEWIRAIIGSHKNTPHDLVNEINETLSEVDRLRSERNTLVHGLWVTPGPENSAIVSTVNLGRNEVIKELVVTAADLHVLIDDALEVASKLHSLVKSIVPIPGRHRAARLILSVAFPEDAFTEVQTTLGFRRNASPYLSTAHASRAFLVAIATTARQ